MKIILRKQYREQYDKLVDERNAIYDQKSSCKSTVGRYSFQPGVLTPSEKMIKATMNRNATRNLLLAYRGYRRRLRKEEGDDNV